MADTNRIGEVIEASSTEFTAQCYELYQSPPLGSLVKSGSTQAEVYGVVYNITTEGIEPGRRPIARGKDEAAEEDVYHSSPQLLKLLRTEFNALVVGHRAEGQVCQYLPPNPARIHGFVYTCLPAEVRDFSRSFSFLNILLGARLPVPAEELVAASLRQMSSAHEDGRSFLMAGGKELALMLGGEFNRLKVILERIKR